MVRLGGHNEYCAITTHDEFQFQYGSIGSELAMPSCVSATPVSIPVWFDWEEMTGSIIKPLWDVSIPVWFDWERDRRNGNGSGREFQFQYGSIVSYLSCVLIYFFEVSIPVWFDWEFEQLTQKHRI